MLPEKGCVFFLNAMRLIRLITHGWENVNFHCTDWNKGMISISIRFIGNQELMYNKNDYIEYNKIMNYINWMRYANYQNT